MGWADVYNGPLRLTCRRAEGDCDGCAFLAGDPEDPVALLLGLRSRRVVPFAEWFPWDVATHL